MVDVDSVEPKERVLDRDARARRQCGVMSDYFDHLLVHGQVTIIFVVIFVVSVCLFVCAEFFSAVFDPIWIKLGHMLHVRVYLCPLEYRGCATPGGWMTPKKLVFLGVLGRP